MKQHSLVSHSLQRTKKPRSIFLIQIPKGSARPWEQSTARRDRNEPCPCIDETGTRICYSRTFAIASICLSIHADVSKCTLPDCPSQFDASKEHNAWVTVHTTTTQYTTSILPFAFCLTYKPIYIYIYTHTILPKVLGHPLLMKGLTTLVISMRTNLNV